jgi:hypothetical protein
MQLFTFTFTFTSLHDVDKLDIHHGLEPKPPQELRPKGTAVAVVHPGVVQTDVIKISGFKAQITAEESADGILNVVSRLTMKNTTGSFYNFLSQPMAW